MRTPGRSHGCAQDEGCVQEVWPAISLASRAGGWGIAGIDNASCGSMKSSVVAQCSCRTGATAARSSESAATIRVAKVWVVRRKLEEGRYDLESRIETILERLLEDLIA